MTATSPGQPATAPGGTTYPITPTSATGGTFAPTNYTISYVNGVLTVIPEPVVVPPPVVLIPPDVAVSPELPYEGPTVKPRVNVPTWVPVVVSPVTPPQLLTLVPPPVVVVPVPVVVQPSAIGPVEVPSRIYTAPPRPHKQDRN